MIVKSTQQVTQYLNHLAISSHGDHDELVSLQRFLKEHRHGATVPEVRWRIQQSAYYPLMGEVRASDPFLPYRILFIMDPAETRLLFLIAGDKSAGNHRGNDWYDAWVPVADAYIETRWTGQFPWW